MSDKKRIQLTSASNFASNIKKKWYYYLGGFVLFVFFGTALFGDSKPQQKAVPVNVGFVDVTPQNVNTATMLSEIQATIRTMNEQFAEDIKKREEKEKKQAAEIAALKEAQGKAIADALADYKKQQAREQELKERAEKNNADLKSNGVVIPTVDSNGRKVPPPPPVFVTEEERRQQQAQNPRPLLPQQNQVQGVAGLNKAMVLSGDSSQSSSAFVLSGSLAKKEDKKEKKQSSFLPSGSFVAAAIITGADFGAGKQTQSNPQPSLLRLQDNAFLPGSMRYKLRDCFALASGYGDLSSERAYMQVTRLSCVDRKTGNVLEANVLGYIADSDGKLGMRGELNRRQGALLAKAMLAGFAEGASSLLSSVAQGAEQTITGAGVVTSIDPKNMGKAAGWAGASGAMERLAEQYIKEADSIFPVIEIDAGRRATIVFQEGQNLVWKDVNEQGAAQQPARS